MALEAPRETLRQDRKSVKRDKAERRRLVYHTLQPILQEIEDLEARIARHESRQKDLEGLMADPVLFNDGQRSVSVVKEYREIRQEVEALLRQWEERQGELEAAKRNLGI
jgi:ATP-binding cassette subfamily F protein 3